MARGADAAPDDEGREVGQGAHDGAHLRAQRRRLPLVASNGGSTDHPQWFKNLTKDPEVELQVHDEVFPARARVATEDEKPAMWREMTSHWPAYDRYQQKTDRPIPVVVLEQR